MGGYYNNCLWGVNWEGVIYFPAYQTEIELPEKSHKQQSLQQVKICF